MACDYDGLATLEAGGRRIDVHAELDAGDDDQHWSGQLTPAEGSDPAELAAVSSTSRYGTLQLRDGGRKGKATLLNSPIMTVGSGAGFRTTSAKIKVEVEWR
jgi:hypothetical protein